MKITIELKGKRTMIEGKGPDEISEKFAVTENDLANFYDLQDVEIIAVYISINAKEWLGGKLITTFEG